MICICWRLPAALARQPPRHAWTNCWLLPDAEELLHWLRHRPLLHHDETLGWTMVHAGLPPQWDLQTAADCAREFEARLQRADYASLLAVLFGDQPDTWSTSLAGIDRLRFTTNCLTRLRYCQPDGKLALKYNGRTRHSARRLLPWFRVPHRASTQTEDRVRTLVDFAAAGRAESAGAGSGLRVGRATGRRAPGRPAYR